MASPAGPTTRRDRVSAVASDYTISAQRQSQTLDAQGQVQQVMVVSFQTIPEGVVGSIDVPLAQYNENTVRSLVEARVAQIRAVHSL